MSFAEPYVRYLWLLCVVVGLSGCELKESSALIHFDCLSLDCGADDENVAVGSVLGFSNFRGDWAHESGAQFTFLGTENKMGLFRFVDSDSQKGVGSFLLEANRHLTMAITQTASQQDFLQRGVGFYQVAHLDNSRISLQLLPHVRAGLQSPVVVSFTCAEGCGQTILDDEAEVSTRQTADFSGLWDSNFGSSLTHSFTVMETGDFEFYNSQGDYGRGHFDVKNGLVTMIVEASDSVFVQPGESSFVINDMTALAAEWQFISAIIVYENEGDGL